MTKALMTKTKDGYRLTVNDSYTLTVAGKRDGEAHHYLYLTFDKGALAYHGFQGSLGLIDIEAGRTRMIEMAKTLSGELELYVKEME